MKKALRSSIKAEELNIKKRFQQAENVIAIAEQAKKQEEGRKPPSKASKKKEVKKEKEEYFHAKIDTTEKTKVLRRTFSITETEYQHIFDLKRRCNLMGFEAAQSEIIRSGLHLLMTASDRELKTAIEKIEKLKPGRAI